MFNKLIFLATVLNLALLGAYWFAQQDQRRKPTPIQPSDDHTEVFQLKEKLEFAALLDENHQWQAGQTTSPQLILRFSFRNCDQCKVSAFYLLDKLRRKWGADRIAALGTFLSDRDFKVFQNAEQRFTLDFKQVPEQHFGLHLEQDAAYPFFFVLHPDGRITHVFVPVKEDVERSLRYLNFIEKKFFANPSSSKASSGL